MTNQSITGYHKGKVRTKKEDWETMWSFLQSTGNKKGKKEKDPQPPCRCLSSGFLKTFFSSPCSRIDSPASGAFITPAVAWNCRDKERTFE